MCAEQCASAVAPDELEGFGLELERRGGNGERGRVATLAHHFARIARDLESRERALERAVKILVSAIVIAFGFGIYLGISVRQQANRTDAVAAEQEVARYRAVYTACLERNTISDSIVTFLVKDLQASAR